MLIIRGKAEMGGKEMPRNQDAPESPVTQAARRALAERDLTPVLLYIPKEAEAELRMEFEETLRVRKLGKGTQEVYDYLFCETALRLHREGSGSAPEVIKVAHT